MKPTFLNCEKPLLTLLFSGNDPDEIRETVNRGIQDGAEAFCLQTCQMDARYHNLEIYGEIFTAMGNRPVYVTNYRKGVNEGVSDQKIADGLLELAESGATLCDVMGDLFDPQPGEMTYRPEAVRKQKYLIEKLHETGAEVLISSHVLHFLPADEVLDIALSQQERGADIVKIVTGASSMDEQLENLRITHLLKKDLKVPFLFLSGGQCELHRRIGPMLGCCMYLCSLDDTGEPVPVQPMLRKVKAIRDNWT